MSSVKCKGQLPLRRVCRFLESGMAGWATLYLIRKETRLPIAWNRCRLTLPWQAISACLSPLLGETTSMF